MGRKLFLFLVNIIYQSFSGNDLLHKLRKSLPLIFCSFCHILDDAGIKIHFHLIAVFYFLCSLCTLNDRQANINCVPVKILAKVSAITQETPAALMAMGACSLEEPQPKFFSATIISPFSPDG